MQRVFVTFFCSSVLLLSSCDEEIGNSKDVNPETIYFEYSMTQDDKSDAELLLRFRFAGPEGTTLVLNKPSEIKFDGMALHLDSSDGMGACYSKIIPYNQSNGTHEILFTGIDGRQYANSFMWQNMECKSPLPDRISQDDITIAIAGGLSGDELEVSIRDTSFDTDDAKLHLHIIDGGLNIPGDAFAAQKEGPLSISIDKYSETPLVHTTAEGGKLFIIQHLGVLKTNLVYSSKIIARKIDGKENGAL